MVPFIRRRKPAANSSDEHQNRHANAHVPYFYRGGYILPERMSKLLERLSREKSDAVAPVVHAITMGMTKDGSSPPTIRRDLETDHNRMNFRQDVRCSRAKEFGGFGALFGKQPCTSGSYIK